jgi:DNA-binding transcriptional ArsR family regulator
VIQPYHREMAILAPRFADTTGSLGLPAAAYLFRGFGDPSRLSILQHLALGEHRVVELTAHLGLAQSTVSKHLACLKDCGLVESRPIGRASMFSLTHPEALQRLFAAAEELLELTGEAVALCPTYGVAAAKGTR